MPELAKSTEVALLQSREFAATMTHLGRPLMELSLPGGRGSVQVMRRRFLGKRVGMISRRDLPRQSLAELARKADCSALLLNAESETGGHGMCLHTPVSVAEWDLRPSAETLRQGLQQKWRNRLNRADRAGMVLSETALSPRKGHWALDLEEQQSRQRRYFNWPQEMTRAYARANRGQVRVFEAHLSGERAAAMLFLCHGGVASYHVGWTGPLGRSNGAHHALLWQAAITLKQRGIRRLDLGQVNTVNAHGLARFKLGTGADLRRLGGTWLAIPAFLRGP